MKQFTKKIMFAAMLLGSTTVTTQAQINMSTHATNLFEAAKSAITSASGKTVALSAAGCLAAWGTIKIAKKIPGFLEDSFLWLKKHQMHIEVYVGLLVITSAAAILISSPVMFCNKDKLSEALLVSLSAYILSVPVFGALIDDFASWVAEREQIRSYGRILVRYNR